MAGSYELSIRLPEGVPASILETASETMIAAQALGGEQAQQLVAAGQAAFSAWHCVLLSAAVLIAVLGVGVGYVLRKF